MRGHRTRRPHTHIHEHKIHTRKHAHTHVCAHAHMSTRTHAHTHTCAHASVCTRSSFRADLVQAPKNIFRILHSLSSSLCPPPSHAPFTLLRREESLNKSAPASSCCACASMREQVCASARECTVSHVMPHAPFLPPFTSARAPAHGMPLLI